MATLNVEGLRRTFDGGIGAVRDATFTVADGRIAALLGPSGCGKTTVLRIVAGLERPDAGDVRIDDHSVLHRPPHRRGVGLMFQELALFPHMNVRENVSFGLRMQRWSRERQRERVDELLRLVGLEQFAARGIDELSGGERQRVALARTLAPQPALLLLDEPLGSLDEERKRTLRSELRTLLREVRTTALLVSHDLRDAVAIADDLLVMQAGTILQAGPLREVVRAPGSAAVAKMVGYVPLLEGFAANGAVHEDGVGAVPLTEGARSRGGTAVLAHPSSLLGVPCVRGLGLGLRARVRAARPDGPGCTVEVELGGRTIEVRWEWDPDGPRAGDLIDLAAPPETLRFFPLEDPQTGSEPARGG